MKHQLKPNTYTICESTEQCKELFEWAKANGIKVVNMFGANNIILAYNGNALWSFNDANDLDDAFIPLPEFISRLKGEWVEGKTVTLSDDEWEVVGNCLYAWQQFNLKSKIEEQLNNK